MSEPQSEAAHGEQSETAQSEQSETAQSEQSETAQSEQADSAQSEQADSAQSEQSDAAQRPQQRRADTSGRSSTVVVVGPNGQPIGTMEVAADDGQRTSDDEDPARLVEQPAKVMRIGSMIKQLLDEVKAAPLDEKARSRLTEIHRRSIVELETGLAPELVEELERLSLPFDEGHTPSEAELRMAQAQLVGWLEGLFHGIQAALVAQQMAARLQLEQMRGGQRALPVGPSGIPGLPGMPGAQPQQREQQPDSGRTGQYL